MQIKQTNKQSNSSSENEKKTYKLDKSTAQLKKINAFIWNTNS